MPNWKKVVTSGSNAHLNQITASNISIDTLQNVSNINPGTGTTGDIDISSAKIEIKASNNSTAGLELFGGTVGSVAPFIDVDSPHTAFVLKVAGTDRMLVNSTGIQINDDNGNFDFQIDGDTNDNVFFLDAGTEKIGIGTNTPGEKLEVIGNISASGAITAINPTLTYTSASIATLANGEGYGEIIEFFPGHGSVDKGDVVAHLGSLGSAWRAGTAAASYVKNMLGVALEDGDGSTPCRVLTRGVVRLAAGHIEDSGGTEGDPLYIGDNTGHVAFAIPGSSGEYARIVGYCLDEDKDIIYFNPDNTFVELV